MKRSLFDTIWDTLQGLVNEKKFEKIVYFYEIRKYLNESRKQSNITKEYQLSLPL